MNFLSRIVCPSCAAVFEKGRALGLCTCGSPLLAEYDLDAARNRFPRDSLSSRPPTMWRYREMLPVQRPENVVSLGEGFTPLIQARRLGAALGLKNLYIKDESGNPTGSFKARGLCAAVSMACELGLRKLAIPSAGNAAGAMAAYSAHAGLECHIFMPADTPRANVQEAKIFGARVNLIHGLITDCGKIVTERKEEEGWFDVSTLKEPYRIEGKKTMGYELAEQFGWELPDVILYPTGGGTGLIGMWKAFYEMETLGWIGEKRPRMFSVQGSGCAPIVRAFEKGDSIAAEFPGAHTCASGLRVPKAIGDFLILNILRQSNGGAVTVDDEEMIRVTRKVGSSEGLFVAPEGAACFAALKSLRSGGKIASAERVVIFNTGSGIKYLDCYES